MPIVQPTADAWYVLRVETGREAYLADRLALWPGVIETFCPMRIEKVPRQGRTVRASRPLWPSYLFVAWPRDDWKIWHSVVGETGEGRLIGVFGILGGPQPVEIPRSLMQSWIDRADDDGVITDLASKIEALRRGYDKGDAIRIEGGPFDGHTGTCVWVDNRGASLQLTLANREISVYVPLVGSQARIVGAGLAANAKTRSRKKRRAVARFFKRLARESGVDSEAVSA